MLSALTGCWSCEAGRSSKRLFYCVSRYVTIFGLSFVYFTSQSCWTWAIWPWSDQVPTPLLQFLMTTLLLVFRSPWRSRRTHCWRHPARCSIHREDRHLRKHRREGPADQKGCHATRVRAWRLEDHQSAVRGEIPIISPVSLFVILWFN